MTLLFVECSFFRYVIMFEFWSQNYRAIQTKFWHQIQKYTIGEENEEKLANNDFRISLVRQVPSILLPLL